ncbi:MAG: hypothetical protein JWO41_330 [Candidatus Saccharibacteria bacterium]|nr:hypothetical protein [Candidatus Saccharibacteria bacterium]
MADNTSNRGFASMDENKQKEIAKKGAQAQPTEAKAKGGKNSHRNQ